MNSQKTSEWPALHEVWEEKKRIIEEREVQHAQHVINQGAPRDHADIWLAALILQKANRIWNNLTRGGDPVALRDSVLDLSNYSDFLAAHMRDLQVEQRGELPVGTKMFPWPTPPGVMIPTDKWGDPITTDGTK